MADDFLIDVVPKRKVIRIKGEDFGTQETFGLYLDVNKQTKADIRNIIAGITISEAEQQENLGNPPTRQLIDGSATKPLLSVERRSVVWFGNEFDQALIRAIEKSLRQSIKRFLPRRVPANVWRYWTSWGRQEIEDVQRYWIWQYRGPEDTRFRRIRRSEFKDLIIPPGGKLILRPRKHMDIAVGYLNHIARNWGLRTTARRGQNAGQTTVDQRQAFMAHAVSGVKRSRWARNYTIYVTSTFREQSFGDARAEAEGLWSYGTPYINIIARMRTNQRGTFRRYRKVSEYR